MNQKKSIVIAGTLAGLILLTLLAFTFTDTSALLRRNDAQAVLPATAVPTEQSADANAQAQIQALQAYTGQLEAALQIMAEREVQYQQQLNTANQTIMELSQPAQPNFAFGDDGFEHEQHELFEHEDE
jgi:hypothetical protein